MEWGKGEWGRVGWRDREGGRGGCWGRGMVCWGRR